jgi:hypothetical protein
MFVCYPEIINCVHGETRSFMQKIICFHIANTFLLETVLDQKYRTVFVLLQMFVTRITIWDSKYDSRFKTHIRNESYL